MDAELEFAIQPNTTGKQLFDQVWEIRFFLFSNVSNSKLGNKTLFLFNNSCQLNGYLVLSSVVQGKATKFGLTKCIV